MKDIIQKHAGKARDSPEGPWNLSSLLFLCPLPLWPLSPLSGFPTQHKTTQNSKGMLFSPQKIYLIFDNFLNAEVNTDTNLTVDTVTIGRLKSSGIVFEPNWNLNTELF